MNITTATPAEIDTETLRLSNEIAANRNREAGMQRAKANRYATTADIAHYAAEIVALDEAYETLAASLAPLEDEFTRRGGWTRYYLVDNTGGHVHSTTECSTCHNGIYRTGFYWLTDQSGTTAEALVELAGDRACTVCFPWAPVETLAKPSRVEGPNQRAAREAREEREAKRAAAAAKKAAAGITLPDGKPVREENWHTGKFDGAVIETERTAQTAYIDAAVDAAVWHPETGCYVNQRSEDMSEAEHVAWMTRNHVDNKRVAEYLLPALAHKSGVDVETKRAELAPKVARKLKQWRK